MYKKLERIRTRLKKARGRPWKVSEENPKHVRSFHKITCCTNLIASTTKEDVAVFIKHSPNDINELTNLVERAANLLKDDPRPEAKSLISYLERDE